MNNIPRHALWVRFPRFIGDGIMIHQAIEPLRAMGFDLVGWGPGPVLELYDGTPYFSALMKDPADKQTAWDMAKLLRTHRPKGVINLARSQRANLAAWLAWVPLRVGWREGMGLLLCNRSLPFKSLSGHQIERYAQLLRKGFPGAVSTDFRPFMPRQAALDEAEALLIPDPAPFVVFALGAMSWSKRMGRKVWIDLGLKALERGWNVVLLGAPGEDQIHGEFIAQAMGKAVDLTGKTSLAVAAAIIHRSVGLIGNDSALSHLASICGIPTVVGFGPTDASMTAPRQPWARKVCKEDLPCLDCQGGACTVPGHPCMEEISTQALLEALLDAQLKRP